MSHYENLPKDANLKKIYEACRAIITAMRDDGKKLESITSDMHRLGLEIKTSALQTFLARGVSHRVNRENETLKSVYNFIVGARHAQSPFVKSVISDNWFTLTNKAIEEEFLDERHKRFTDTTVSSLFGSWFHVSQLEYARMYSKQLGSFVMLRKSISQKDTVVISKLEIYKTPVSTGSSSSIIGVTHTHYDMYSKKRVSTGFLTPVVRNIYCVLNVEDGEGIEFIALREPIQTDFEKNLGFLTSINADRKLLSSRVFLERSNSDWINFLNAGFARFNIHDQSLPQFILRNLKTYLKLLDEETSRTIPVIALDPLNPFAVPAVERPTS